MAEHRRKFSRPFGNRPYRKLFVIAVEGDKTEPMYFSLLKNSNSIIQIKCLKGAGESSPPHVLARMTRHLKKEGLKATDEAWLVVDKDQWTDVQLNQLHDWSQCDSNRGFALSNPMFEFWLLLHFEDGNKVNSQRDCVDRLKRHLPEFDKVFDARKFALNNIAHAITRAKQRDNPPCTNWPRSMGATTVYRLVEKLLEPEPHG